VGRGRGRGRSILQSAEKLHVGRGTEGVWKSVIIKSVDINESQISQSHVDVEMDRSTEVSVAGTLGEISILREQTEGNMSGGRAFQNDSFREGQLILTSTPTHSRDNSNAVYFQEKYLRPIGQPVTKDQHVITEIVACDGCKAMETSQEKILIEVAAMKTEMNKLKEIVTALSTQIEQLVTPNLSKSSSRPAEEIFTDNRLMRIKAAAFLTGRPLSSHVCTQLVTNLYDNEPPISFDSDDIKAINDRRECHDAPTLSKWAVFELFSLQELVGRNCLGGGHDTACGSGLNAETKKPFDELKMNTIKNAVFNLYPQQSEAMRKGLWLKCVDKINTDVRYLFKVSMKKHLWLQVGL
jgi:hypothetical protein